jgi:di/tricarboxylate transporter
MSSMRKIAFLIPLVIGSAALAQLVQTDQPRPAALPAATGSAAVNDINYSLGDWRRLRASEGYRFADYARVGLPLAALVVLSAAAMIALRFG